MHFYLQRRAARSRPSRQRCLRRTAQSGYDVTSPFKSASKRRAAVKEDTTRTHFLSILFDCTTDTEHFSEHYQFSLKMLKKNAGIPFGSQINVNRPDIKDFNFEAAAAVFIDAKKRFTRRFQALKHRPLGSAV